MSTDGTPEKAAATGGFTQAQLASIGEVVQGLVDKALHRDRPTGGRPTGGDGDGPSRANSDGVTGELEARGRAGVWYGMGRRTRSAR